MPRWYQCLFPLVLLAALGGCGGGTPAPLAIAAPDKVGERGNPKPDLDPDAPPGTLKPSGENPNGIEPPSTPPSPFPLSPKDSDNLIDSILARADNDGRSGRDRYEESVRDAWRFVAEGNEAEALKTFKRAAGFDKTEYVVGEIARLEAVLSQKAAGDKAADDIQPVLASGNAMKASELATTALKSFVGDADDTRRLEDIKRQSDALLSQQLAGRDRQQRFIDEATVAKKDGSLRLAALSYERALANGVDDADFRRDADSVRQTVARYDESRARGAELRRDPQKLEEAVAVYKVALEAWDTPQIRQELSDTQAALEHRRDRVAIGEFETIGDVGIPLAGRIIAEEMLPFFRARFDVVERSQLNGVLGELKLTFGDLQSNEVGRAEVARLAKANFMVVGSVSRLNGIVINARLIDVRSSLIVQTARMVVNNPEQLSRHIGDLAKMLQMTDNQKIAYENGLNQQVQAIAPPQTAIITAAPVVVVNAPAPAAIVVSYDRAPALGRVTFQSFTAIPQAQPVQTQVLVYEADPVLRERSQFVSTELGDNLFRRAEYPEALRHFEFALSLSPGNRDLRIRIDRCRPFVQQVVFVAPPRPRLAILNFAELGNPQVVPPGYGGFLADLIAPYMNGAYSVVDRNEVFWWMARLGLNMQDVVANPQARLCLARAMGVRYILTGVVRDELAPNPGNGFAASFIAARAFLIDAEFNSTFADGAASAPNFHQLKFCVGEIARMLLLDPAQRIGLVRVNQEFLGFMDRGRGFWAQNNYPEAFDSFQRALAAKPESTEARWHVDMSGRRLREWQFQENRRVILVRQQEAIAQQQAAQVAFAQQAQQARIQAIAQQQAFAEADRARIAAQQEQAYQGLVIQARTSSQQNNFSVSIGLFQSALNMRRNESVAVELAQVRAKQAQLERTQQVQQVQIAQLAQSRQTEFDASVARNRLVQEETRRKAAEVEAQQQLAARNKGEYDKLLDRAQRAQSQGNFEASINALQAARRINPNPEVERLVSAALVDQARVNAEKKGQAEKAALEAQLAIETTRRKAAEAEAATNKQLYETAMAQAQQAMQAKQYETAASSFRTASLKVRSPEALAGIQKANDAAARDKAAAAETAKAQAETEQKEARYAALLRDGKAALDAGQYPQGLNLLRQAAALKPGAVEVQKEIVRGEGAREAALAKARAVAVAPKAKDPAVAVVPKVTSDPVAPKDPAVAMIPKAKDPAVVPKPKDPAVVPPIPMPKDPATDPKYIAAVQAGVRAMQAKKYDEAIVSLTEAQKINPNPKLDILLADAKQKQQAQATAMLNQAQLAKEEAAAMAAKAATQAAANAAMAQKQQALTAAIRAGQAAFARKDYAEAVNQFAAAKAIVPTNPDVAALLKQATDARTAAMTPPVVPLPKPKDPTPPIPLPIPMPMPKKDPAPPIPTPLPMPKPKDPAPPIPVPLPLPKPKDPTSPTPLPKPKDPVPPIPIPVPLPKPKDPTPPIPTPLPIPIPKKDPAPPIPTPLPMPKKDPAPLPIPKKDNPEERAASLTQAGLLAEAKRSYAEAAANFTEALKLTPTNVGLKRRIDFDRAMVDGLRDLQAGKFAGAVLSLDQAVRLDPNNADAKAQLAKARAGKK